MIHSIGIGYPFVQSSHPLCSQILTLAERIYKIVYVEWYILDPVFNKMFTYKMYILRKTITRWYHINTMFGNRKKNVNSGFKSFFCLTFS